MSRRGMIGAGLVVLGAGIYLTGPADRGNDALSASSPPPAMKASTATVAAAPVATTAAPAPASTAPKASAEAVPKAQKDQVPQKDQAPAPSAAPAAQPLATAPPPSLPSEAKVEAQVSPAPAAPRMINGPATAASQAPPRPIPTEGPRNGDVPPPAIAKGNTPPAVLKPVSLPQTPPQRTEPPKPPLKKDAAAPKAPASDTVSPKRTPAKPDRAVAIISAEAQPAPRANPPPRVQW